MEYHIVQAYNMRQGLISIYEKYGADAMICESRTGVGCVEILVGLNNDEQAPEDKALNDINHHELEKNDTNDEFPPMLNGRFSQWYALLKKMLFRKQEVMGNRDVDINEDSIDERNISSTHFFISGFGIQKTNE